MNVLSLFDGMSGAMAALQSIGIKPTNYFACEIDKYSEAVSKYHYPEIVRFGDVTKLTGGHLPKIELLVAGFPCQSFSLAGKQLNFNDPRGKLFFEVIRLIEELQPTYFLLENVRMKKDIQDEISRLVGVQPIQINSALLSAQNRVRNYWTNIPGITQPEDKGIILMDIIDDGFCDKDKSYTIDANYYKGGNPEQYFDRSRRQLVFIASIVGRRINENGTRDDYNKNISITQCLQVKHNNTKSGTLTTVDKDNVLTTLPPGRYLNTYDGNICWRKLTPIECERLQTFPDDFTKFGIDANGKLIQVSNSQRYKMLGNGFTRDVIAHILTNIRSTLT